MEIFAKLKSIQGNQIKLSIDEDFDMYKLDKYSDGKQPTIELRIDDGRSISAEQRKKIYALFRDISDYTGYVTKEEQEALPDYMKYEYLIETGSKMFSLSNCSMTVAHDYLEWIIDFCFKYDIPFKTRTWDMLPVDYAMQKRCLLNRKCCICGKPADIAHFETVGTGRNRKHIDHSDYHFMALCREHHTEQHKIGLLTFLKKYVIKPIKLTQKEITKLKIAS